MRKALKVLLNATQKLKSLRDEVRSCKEVGHRNKVWLVISSRGVCAVKSVISHCCFWLMLKTEGSNPASSVLFLSELSRSELIFAN